MAETAEVKVLGAPAMRTVMNGPGPQFERTTGHKLVIKFEVSAVFKRQIEAGETFDVAIFTPAVIGDLSKQDKIAAGTRAGGAGSSSLPSVLQTYIGFTAGVSASAEEPEAAKALIKRQTPRCQQPPTADAEHRW